MKLTIFALKFNFNIEDWNDLLSAEELESTNKIALYHNSCDSEPAAVINQNKNSNMFLIRNVWGFDDYDNKEVSENELKAIIKEKKNIH